MLIYLTDHAGIFTGETFTLQQLTDPIPRGGIDAPPPVLTGTEVVQWVGQRWVILPERPTPPPVDIATLAQAKLTAINDGKNTALDGGFVHDGKLFDSDSKARLAYLELSLKLSQDTTYSTPWKASTGVWVTMDAALFAALQPAYEAHIQSCFAWQAAREMEVAAAVEAGDVGALAEVEERI